MEPRAFLDLADALSKGNTPAEYRTAISRAYYAIYCAGVEALLGMNIRITKGPSGHGMVRDCLSNAGDADLSKVGAQLHGLYSKRIKADYQLREVESENEKAATAAVSQATRMLETMEQCTSGPNRDALIQAIKEYRHKTNR